MSLVTSVLALALNALLGSRICGCASVSAAIPLSCPLQICYEPIVQNHAAVFGILPLPPSLI